MKNLTKQDYKNIENKMNYDHMTKGKKHTNKLTKLLKRQYDRNASVLKNEYPNLNDEQISEILADYREYQNLISAIETFTDFPMNYEDSNIQKFMTNEDIEDLNVAIEEMTSFIERLELK